MDGEQEILPELYSDTCWDEMGRRLHLSRRQKAVARLLCLGMHTSEVADRLNITTNTVRMHQRYLYRR
ncbi:MAG: hypothetical protein JXO22_01115, partial [Phycisphaerae bacterium]|nr:hypothetical protein [Phycisphaerae bacterium]